MRHEKKQNSMNYSKENKTLSESFPEEVDIQLTKKLKPTVLNVLK